MRTKPTYAPLQFFLAFLAVVVDVTYLLAQRAGKSKFKVSALPCAMELQGGEAAFRMWERPKNGDGFVVLSPPHGQTKAKPSPASWLVISGCGSRLDSFPTMDLGLQTKVWTLAEFRVSKGIWWQVLELWAIFHFEGCSFSEMGFGGIYCLTFA